MDISSPVSLNAARKLEIAASLLGLVQTPDFS